MQVAIKGLNDSNQNNVVQQLKDAGFTGFPSFLSNKTSVRAIRVDICTKRYLGWDNEDSYKIGNPNIAATNVDMILSVKDVVKLLPKTVSLPIGDFGTFSVSIDEKGIANIMRKNQGTQCRITKEQCQAIIKAIDKRISK